MHRRSRSAILAISAPGDSVLHAVAPLGLAASAGPAIVVDLDREAPPYPGDRTLAMLAADGPRRDDLVPARSGVAVLANGGIGPDEAIPLIEALAGSWPAVVVRSGRVRPPFPLVRVFGLLPGLTPAVEGPAVYQRLGPGSPPRLSGLVLPPVGRGDILRMLAGGRPGSRRWVVAWRRAWELRWE